MMLCDHCAKTTRKRFQSGSEVLKTYIPDYQEPVPVASESDVVQEASELVDKLLEPFNRQIDRLRKRVASDDYREVLR